MTTPVTAKSPRISAFQRKSLILIVVAGTVNILDRSTLAIANPLIRQDLGLSISDMGILLSAFLLAYAWCQLPVGFIIDRTGPRRALGWGILLWSIAQGVTGLVTGFWQFIIMRVLLGVGEAPMFPASVALIRGWWPARRRGLPTGIMNIPSGLGAAIAPPLLTALMLWMTWRGMFIAMGVLGVVVAFVWFAVIREARQVKLDAGEQAYLTEGETEVSFAPVTGREWRRLFTFRTIWGMILGTFCASFVLWLYNAWLPGYLEIQHHLDIRTTGFVASVPFVFAIGGAVIAGWVADRLMAAGFSPMNSRKIPIIFGLVGLAAFTFLAAMTSSVSIAVACISGAMFFTGGLGPLGFALAGVAVPANCTGSLGAIQNFGNYIGAAAAPVITGFIVQDTGSFVPAFLLAAALAVVGVIAYAFIVPSHPITSADLAGTGADPQPVPSAG
jgi:MFS family permease